jgi:hypothetical protein
VEVSDCGVIVRICVAGLSNTKKKRLSGEWVSWLRSEPGTGTRCSAHWTRKLCVSVIWLLGHMYVSAHTEDEFTNLHMYSNNIYGKCSILFIQVGLCNGASSFKLLWVTNRCHDLCTIVNTPR